MINKWLVILILFYNANWSQVTIESKFYGNATPGGKGELNVQINRHNINTFAKYQIEAPEGVTINELDVKGGNFSVEGNKYKVIWINLPSESEFTIKFKVSFNENATFPVTLYQKFYFLENSIKKEVSAKPLIIQASDYISQIKKESDSDNPQTNTIVGLSASTSKKSNMKEENNAYKNISEKKEENKILETSKTNNNSPIKTNIPESEGYTYKIQVAASATYPNKDIYSNLGKIEIIQHKGMYKVMIDRTFSSKEEALQYRQEIINKGYTGAFLVKYQNGQRIN